MKGLVHFCLTMMIIAILAGCSTAPDPVPTLPITPQETPTPIPPTEEPVLPTEAPEVEEETSTDVVFSFYDPDRKSILPGEVYTKFPGVNTEAGGIVYHDGSFHNLYNLLYN
ncbi:MAG: hypothetical protein ACK2T7_07315 [Anaerolineales bacterium]